MYIFQAKNIISIKNTVANTIYKKADFFSLCFHQFWQVQIDV